VLAAKNWRNRENVQQLLQQKQRWAGQRRSVAICGWAGASLVERRMRVVSNSRASDKSSEREQDRSTFLFQQTQFFNGRMLCIDKHYYYDSCLVAFIRPFMHSCILTSSIQYTVLYISIQPHIWDRENTITTLQICANCTAARLIKDLSPRGHITRTLKQLHWLPIYARTAFKTSLLMYHIHSENSPALHHTCRPWLHHALLPGL